MDNEYLIRSAKHLVKKAMGKPDPVWPFYSFEHAINPKTLALYPKVLAWAHTQLEHKEQNEAESAYEVSIDPVVQQGWKLKKETEEKFRNKRVASSLRILVQIPDQTFSPGGYSALSNFLEALTFIGVQAFPLGWDNDTETILRQFRPNVLMVTDHVEFLKRINWDSVAHYKSESTLHIGLLAHLEEYGNTPVKERLTWAKHHDVRFYFSFRNEAYYRSREAYKPFFQEGFDILPLEFGANILYYYPVPNIVRDLDYVFLASTNSTKGPQYSEFARRIVSRYVGFIDGGGWKHVSSFSFNKPRDRYVYARGKVGLNFHLQEQVDWACEVNERTHQLAACGIPQVTNNAKLLPTLYGPETILSASNGKEFQAYFERLVRDSEYAKSCALRAQHEVFDKYTTFHRADDFINRLEKLLT